MYIKNLTDILDITINNSAAGDIRILSRVGTNNWSDYLNVLTTSIGNSNSSLLTEAAIKAILPSSDHGELDGLSDDDHAQYLTEGRADTWLAAGHESTFNHSLLHNHSNKIVLDGISSTNVSNWNTAYGWGDHDGLYEPIFIHETGFNLPLGTTAGTVAEGNHTHSSYITTSSVTYETLDSNGDVGSGAGQLAIGNHTHSGVYAPNSHTHTMSEISDMSGVTSGTYTNADITVDQYGRVTSASNGTISTTYWTVSGDNIHNNNSGNVGIGTTSPYSKLDVTGNFTISNDTALGSGAQMVQNFVAYNAQTSPVTQKVYGNIAVVVVDNTVDSEDANMYINTLKGGSTSTDIAILSGVAMFYNGVRIDDGETLAWNLRDSQTTYIKGIKGGTTDYLEFNAMGYYTFDTYSDSGYYKFYINNSEILNISPNGINLGSSSPAAANSIVADGSITAGVDITVGGILKPDTDSGADIGETAKRFKSTYLDLLYAKGNLILDSTSDQEIWQKNGNDIKIYSDGSGKVILNTRIQLQLTTMESGELDVGTSWEHVARINITPDMVGLKIKSMYISCGTKPSHTLYVGARRADASGTLMGTYYEVFSTTPAYTSTGNILREFTGVNTSNNTLADKEVLDIRCYYASTPTTKAKDVVVTLILDL